MSAGITTLVIVAVLGIGGAVGWSKVAKEHEEARSVSLSPIAFDNLCDGTYDGEYEGGMYKWRAGRVRVVISSGRVTDVILLNTADPGAQNTAHDELFDRVVDAQTIQVDAVGGATLTSKAYLKAVENALAKAKKQK